MFVEEREQTVETDMQGLHRKGCSFKVFLVYKLP